MTVHGFWGVLHTIAAAFALLAGTWVLRGSKGTRAHKRSGHLYVVTMVAMLLSSFYIYRVYNRFGLFHVLAVVSSLTLMLGITPMWFKNRTARHLQMHFRFMYWSVIGLYAAFAAELFVRVPAVYRFFSATHQEKVFHSIVTAATLTIVATGFVVFKFKKDNWTTLVKKFADKSKTTS